MYPPMLVFLPELALAMLTSRTMHLAGAEQNAAKYGASGARFPWEAAHTGNFFILLFNCSQPELEDLK